MSASSWKRAAIRAAICISLSAAVAPAAPVQAIDLGTIGTIIGAGVQYASLNKQLSYLDNEATNSWNRSRPSTASITTRRPTP